MNINELEILRKKARNVILIGMLISAILAFILGYTKNSLPTAYSILFFGFIISILLSNKPKKKFIIAFKDFFVLNTLKSVFTDLNYFPERGIDEQIIRNTQMMNMGDRYTSNDYINAKYKNINFIQADVHIEEKHQSTDSNGHTTTTWITIFKGRWMIFDFNKTFKANIQVSQKGFGNSRIKNFGQKLKYQKISMEDQLFNKQFRTYAQNDHDAFYILTPALMEKIKKLGSTIRGKILLCFIDNKLHVGIQNNKDSFEHSIFVKINETKVINEITKDIKLITNFIDELDLDNDLFRKEV